MERSRIALVTLGCARNEVDSEELAGLLAADGWEVVPEVGDAQVVVVNTCGFVESAKQESIEVLLAAHESGQQDGGHPKIVAVGCMAQRYGQELAQAMPEVDAVLGFDSYPAMSEHLRQLLAGADLASHRPSDRRQLLPVSTTKRQQAGIFVPGHADLSSSLETRDGDPPPARGGGASAPGWHWQRRRLSSGPVAALKIASGCDRKCAFCAIPAIRGLFISRPIGEVVAEAKWLVDHGVREVILVSENSTSYGKDLDSGPGRRPRLEDLLEALNPTEGLVRIRVSYLQPAEVRPSLIKAMIQLPKVANYFDLSFQHASATLLRRMRRFGGTGPFLDLLNQIREMAPESGIRSNFILGFPGETTRDLDELEKFLQLACLDAVGLFGYSDEEGTEGAALGNKIAEGEVAARVEAFAGLADELMSQRADDRIGTTLVVMAEAVGPHVAAGRAEHQGPEDSGTEVHLDPESEHPQPGDLVAARAVAAEGVDLVAIPYSTSGLGPARDWGLTDAPEGVAGPLPLDLSGGFRPGQGHRE